MERFCKCEVAALIEDNRTAIKRHPLFSILQRIQPGGNRRDAAVEHYKVAAYPAHLLFQRRSFPDKDNPIVLDGPVDAQKVSRDFVCFVAVEKAARFPNKVVVGIGHGPKGDALPLAVFFRKAEEVKSYDSPKRRFCAAAQEHPRTKDWQFRVNVKFIPHRKFFIVYRKGSTQMRQCKAIVIIFPPGEGKFPCRFSLWEVGRTERFFFGMDKVLPRPCILKSLGDKPCARNFPGTPECGAACC